MGTVRGVSDRANESVSQAGRFIVALLTLASLGCGPATTQPDPDPTPQTGSLTVTVTGLPTGQAVTLVVTGPDGFTRALTTTETLVGLSPGTYAVTADGIAGAQGTWAPDTAVRQTTVTAGETSTITFAYAEQFGSLTVSLSGLPNTQPGSVNIAGGPTSDTYSVAATSTLTGVRPGNYTISASTVGSGQNVFDPTPATATVAVAANANSTSSVAYALRQVLPTDGTLQITITGLPAGADAAVSVLASGNPIDIVTSSAILTLSAGDYTLTAATVVTGTDSYAPSPTSQAVTVPQGGSVSASVTYVLVQGNQAPTADPGGPYIAYVGFDPVVLDASASSDGDGTIVSYRWSLRPGPALAGIASSFTCVSAAEVVVVLTVTDDAGATGQSTTTLSCRDAPVSQLLGRWVDGTGSPITTVMAGATAYLQICSGDPETTSFQGDLSIDSSLGAPGIATDLDSGAAGVHPDCAGTMDQLSSLTATGGVGTWTLATSSPTPGTGAGPQGIATIPFMSTVGGTVSPTITNESGFTDSGAPIAFTSDVRSLIVQTFTFTEIQAGSLQTCGLGTSGAAYCWGSNGATQNLGVGTTDQWVTRPTLVINSDVGAFTSIVDGGAFTCGLDGAGSAWCWGYNAHGQTGNGTQAQFDRPQRVSGQIQFSSLSAGRLHMCGVDLGGATYCWGQNLNGWALGAGGSPSLFIPTLVNGLPQLSQVSSGFSHTCGLAGSTAWCWGEGYGAPVQAAQGFSFVEITTGYGFTCGLEAGGTAYCWGFNNGSGQFGDGTTTSSATPVQVQGGPFNQIDTGFETVCAVAMGGEGYCWGANFTGAGGTGQLVNAQLTPSRVAGGHQLSRISTFQRHSCGLTTTGQALCWGAGTSGSLGNGTLTSTLSPVAVLPPN